MGSRPDDIRNDIDQTRRELAQDVDRLADRTVPSRVVQRRWEGVKEKVRGVTDSVMGSSDSPTGSGPGVTDKVGAAAARAGDTLSDAAAGAKERVGDAASRVGDQVGDTAAQVAEGVRQAPTTVARQTRGNPLAAGLIAFGAGLLAASLLPDTDAERRAGVRLADHTDGIVDKAKEMGQELRDELSGPVQHAVSQVKETAKGAASNTADQAKESGRTTVAETKSAATQ